MSKGTNLRGNDRIMVLGEEYQLLQNLSSPLRGFQFRTRIVKKVSNDKKYVAKITQEPERALNELRIYLYLKSKGYEKRYYPEMVDFDHEATLINRRNHHKFWVILLNFLAPPQYLPLDQFLKKGLPQRIVPKLITKLRKRINGLHQLGITHGDIKEANIMVRMTKKGVGLRLIDFGLSKIGFDERSKAKDIKKIENIVMKLQR